MQQRWGAASFWTNRKIEKREHARDQLDATGDATCLECRTQREPPPLYDYMYVLLPRALERDKSRAQCQCYHTLSIENHLLASSCLMASISDCTSASSSSVSKSAPSSSFNFFFTLIFAAFVFAAVLVACLRANVPNFDG